jgi:hypothetical protein
MKKDDYERYLASFNARDYQEVLRFWAPEFEASFAGVVLRNAGDLLRFYEFFHSYVSERITVSEFVSDDRLAAPRAAEMEKDRRRGDRGFDP